MQFFYSPQHSGITRKPSKANADVVVNPEHLLLIARQFRGRPFQRNEHGMRVGAHAHHARALFDGFQCIFDLVQPALWGDCRGGEG